MLKKILLTSAIACLLCTSAFAASGNDNASKSGPYASVEVSSGMTLHKKFSQVKNPDAAVKLAAGYRFMPQLILAAGVEGITSPKTDATSIPIFLELRSDFLPGMVSPFMQLDLGWAFQVPSTRLNYTNCLIKTEGDPLANGQRRYLDASKYWGDRMISKDGFFLNLTAGCSFRVSHENRQNIYIGVTGGMADYNEGIYVRDNANRLHRYSRLDGGRVIEGRPSLKDYFFTRYHAEIRFKIGYAF